MHILHLGNTGISKWLVVWMALLAAWILLVGRAAGEEPGNERAGLYLEMSAPAAASQSASDELLASVPSHAQWEAIPDTGFHSFDAGIVPVQIGNVGLNSLTDLDASPFGVDLMDAYRGAPLDEQAPFGAFAGLGLEILPAPSYATENDVRFPTIGFSLAF